MDELPSEGKELLGLTKNAHDPPGGARERVRARLAVALVLDPGAPESPEAAQVGSLQASRLPSRTRMLAYLFRRGAHALVR